MLEKLFQPSELQMFSAADVLAAMIVSSLLCFVLLQVYSATHRGTGYSRSFIQTMFIMAVATSVVMLIIGSNIARAFSLVGALSVIRFRTAVKDSRDTGYLYASMVVGMGCGTGFYMPAVTFTVFISLLMTALHYIDIYLEKQPGFLLRVAISGQSEDTLAKLTALLEELFDDYTQVSRIHECEDGSIIFVFALRTRERKSVDDCEKRLADLKGIKRFTLFEAGLETPI